MRIRTIPIPRRITLSGAIAISLLAALVCAVLSVASISLRLPPKLEPREIQIAAAATHLLIDSQRSWVLDEMARGPDFTSLTNRAELYGNLSASPPVRERIGRRIGVGGDRIAATVRVTAGVPRNLRDPDSEQRAQQIAQSRKPYQLDLQSDPVRPILSIYAQAPTPAEAVRLADAVTPALREHLRERAARAGGDPRQTVRLDQLGRARGGVINAGAVPQIAVLTFLVVFGLCCCLFLAASRARRGWIAARDERVRVGNGGAAVSAGSGIPTAAGDKARETRADGGDWPRTTRVLPWMIAVFMSIIWLLPFNTIELTASLPVDLKLDRLILPFLIGTWVLALAAGGPGAPRVRVTGIHAGIAGFVGVTCIGVVLSALYLNQTLELGLTTKKLTLLFLYLLLFVMIASTVRRAEVPAFFAFTLALASLCALGTVWEYRFEYNVFYDWAGKLLPPIFTVEPAEAGLVDSAGRYLTRGPGEHPLEAVAMMTMALPIAFAGLLGTADRRRKVVYALAACVLIAAAVSTYRKSALLAPLSVCLTLMYFRARELLRLAPLAVVFIVVIQMLAPGAANSILSQLQPGQLGVGTVSDRASDYDAVRPDLWTNPLFGRGYGSYDHVSYRILDSEALGRLVDTGILGFLALVLMLVSMVVAARALIRARHPVWTPPALSLAAAAVAFLVLCFLFDVSSFPHAPYVLMTLAGFFAALVSQIDGREVGRPVKAAARACGRDDEGQPLGPRAASGGSRPRELSAPLVR